MSLGGCALLLDYRPRRVDVGALLDGSLAELINLVPIGGLDLTLVPLRLRGVQGWGGLGAAAAHEWLRDIVSTQVRRCTAAQLHSCIAAPAQAGRGRCVCVCVWWWW